MKGDQNRLMKPAVGFFCICFSTLRSHSILVCVTITMTMTVGSGEMWLCGCETTRIDVESGESVD